MKRVRASVVCVSDDRLLCVRLEDPKTGVQRLFPPGGAVEEGELPFETAAREALEETGFHVLVDPDSEDVLKSPFVWNGVEYQCETYFFRGALDAQAPQRQVFDASYHRGVEWLPVAEIADTMSYDSAILGAVLRQLPPESQP